jgi:hypothetical protein
MTSWKGSSKGCSIKQGRERLGTETRIVLTREELRKEFLDKNVCSASRKYYSAWRYK